MRFRFICILLAALLIAACPAQAAEGHTREEVRSRFAALGQAPEGSAYEVLPSVAAPYAEGSVREEVLEDAVNYLNFLRWLADLPPVSLDKDLTFIAQSGATLLAANGQISHQPEKPEDMPEDFYERASYAAASSNLASLNWMREEILRDAIEFFATDPGENNLPVLGHRRWILNPEMGYTGLGLASSEEGISFVAMYAHDLQGTPGEWTYVAWPAAGAFPAELMEEGMAWSIVLNPQTEIGDLRITLRELSSDRTWIFPGDGFFTIDTGAYGAGPCIIFRPEGEMEYRQNQRFLVQVEGLDIEISYAVDLISLYPISVVSVELSQTSAELVAGESLSLQANVVPDWADHTDVVWNSSDPSVATVDQSGLIQALSPGSCRISATAEGEISDSCLLTVS